jgi:peptidoglycan/LPS O-acetylase OafA/YrhL
MTLLKDAFIVKTLLYYLFYFLIGMWIFLKQIRFSEKMENYFNVVFILILTAHYIVPQLRQLTIGDLASSYNGYLNELLPLLMIPLISNAVLRKSSSLDRTLGDMSYVMYLCHWLLIMPYTYYSKGTSFIQRIPYSLAYVLVTLLVSYLIYKYYDRPIDSLRRKWINSMK